MGEKVKNPTTGEEWQIGTPLDFLVVADHVSVYGSFPELYAESKTGKDVYTDLHATGQTRVDIWSKYVDTAE